MDNGFYLTIDFTKERDKTMHDESIVKSETDILELLDKGISSLDVASAAIVSREIGEAPEDIIRPNKALLLTGAQNDISQIIRKVMVEVEGKNGNVYETSAFVGKLGRMPFINSDDSDDDDQEERELVGPSYVRVKSDLGLARAERRLANTIPGHIFECFKKLKVNDISVRQAADKLIDEIELMVGRLE